MADPTGTTPVDANQVELMKQIADLMKQQAEAMKQIAGNNQKNKENEDARLERLKEIHKVTNETIQNQRASLKNREEEREYLADLKKDAEEQLKILKQKGDTNSAEVKRLKEIVEYSKEQGKELDKIISKEEKRKEFNKDILADMKQQLAAATGLNGIFASINSGLSISQAIFKEYATNAAELLKTVLQANVDYAKATGELAEDKRPALFANNLNQFGIGFEKMNKASIDLFKNMNNFSNQTKEVREELAATAAKLDLLGISAGTTGKTLESLTLGMKMSTAEAINTTNEMARAAIGAGIAPQKMADEFAANIGKLAAYGKQGIQIYIDLQKQAKSLGIELNTLNGIVGDQFDTFEGAARAAGKLNAVLGGNYLNSVEMLNATESERILILKRSFDESGKNFDALSKYEKKAVAATLGITDLNEASKLFGKSTADLTMDMEKQSATQDKLNEVMRNAATIGDKMKELFTVFAPVVRLVAFAIELLVNTITRINDVLGGFGSVIISVGFGLVIFGTKVGTLISGALTGLLGMITKLGGSLGGLLGKINIFSKATEEAGATTQKASGGMAESIKKMGTAASESATGLLALGGAILMIGAGIALASLGLAQLVTAFKGLENAGMALAAVIAVMVGFTTVVGILAFVGTAAVGPILALGAAFVLIGGGIALAANGIAKMIESMSALVTTMNAENGFFNSMENFLSLLKFEGIETATNGITSSIIQIGEALASIPEGKDVSLRTLNETLNVAKTITEDNIKPTKDFVNVVKEYYQFQAASKEADKDALVQALKEVTKAFSTEEKEREITLVIKGGDLAAAFKGEKKDMIGLLIGRSG